MVIEVIHFMSICSSNTRYERRFNEMRVSITLPRLKGNSNGGM